jgi:hypothetical protein
MKTDQKVSIAKSPRAYFLCLICLMLLILSQVETYKPVVAQSQGAKSSPKGFSVETLRQMEALQKEKRPGLCRAQLPARI